MVSSISERIVMIIDSVGISKTEFAKKLKITPAYVSKMVNKDYEPSDRLIDSICSTFDVNEEWLRNGTGSMFIPKSENMRVQAWIDKVLAGRPEDIRYRAVSLLADMPDEWWDILADRLALEAQKIYRQEQIADKVKSYEAELEAEAAYKKSEVLQITKEEKENA